ncbi:MAG TPA: pyridoxamine 5'-phosphate oxidase family protein [Acidimicrobiales bacterium]|nr:pyridoxamine 5'-phosphate oxidase family protein [Acidimicrobiales bacterium]
MSETKRSTERPSQPAPSPRVRVRRLAERGHYESSTIDSILDEGLVCHIGFAEAGSPVVIPTAYARTGDLVYLHGAVGNAALRALATGAPACVTVTLVDGLVLARSAFHHSLNYRSVVIFGCATEVTDIEEKRTALTAIVEHIVPGRAADARPPSDAELRATRVVSMSISEASAKVRVGGPNDDPEDVSRSVWAGHVPLRLVADVPVPDREHPPSVPPPGYVREYARGPEPVVREGWAIPNR